MAFNFKTEEDVKAYLENIYMEYRFGCHKEKHGNACHLLGDYEESINNDNEKAATIYKANCDERNWPRSCGKFGSFKAHGKGCSKDLVESFNYLQKGCELNDERACHDGGVLTTFKNAHLREDRKEQIKIGAKMWEKACYEHNMEPSCFLLSVLYLRGIKEYFEPNLREAYKLGFKSCEMGNPYACANLSQMHAKGEGAQKNEELARKFKVRAELLAEELNNLQRQLKFQQES